MSNIFSSRKQARDYAEQNGGKVVDRGSHLEEGRWKVVSLKFSQTKSTGKKMPKFSEQIKKIVDDQIDDRNTAVIDSLIDGMGKGSQFFASRSAARKFKATVNGTVVDHAASFGGGTKAPEIVKDLEANNKRWEVIYNPSSKVQDPVEETETKAPESAPAAPVKEGEPIIILTMKNLTVGLPSGKQFVMSRSHEDFAKCSLLFAEGKIDELLEAIDVEKKVKEWSFGEDIKVIEGKMYHYGMVVDSSIAKRITEDCMAGNEVEKYINFFRKLMKNPSYKAVKMVYDFIKHNDLQILDNGDILAYKKVDAQGRARGNVPNFKGMTISMPRNMVEDNPEVTCSYGLHVASKEYFKHQFTGGLLLELAVSPENIVSVPIDYNNSKCRSCQYTVLTGLKKPDNIPTDYMVNQHGQQIKSLDYSE